MDEHILLTALNPKTYQIQSFIFSMAQPSAQLCIPAETSSPSDITDRIHRHLTIGYREIQTLTHESANALDDFYENLMTDKARIALATIGENNRLIGQWDQSKRKFNTQLFTKKFTCFSSHPKTPNASIMQALITHLHDLENLYPLTLSDSLEKLITKVTICQQKKN